MLRIGNKNQSQERWNAPVNLAGYFLLAVLIWCYWPTLGQMTSRWSQDPQYTHGYVVPLFAAMVLWFRRDSFPRESLKTSWWGLLLLALGGALHLAGAVYSFEWLEGGSLVPSLAGVIWLVWGPGLLRWCWPAGVFLLFVLPWPWQIDSVLTQPLRRVATLTSTYALQTLGYPALAQGNIIAINDMEVGVVEACSGLGMLMTFFALSTAVALVVQRSLTEKIILFLSAIPIGVLMNVGRITLTVILFQEASPELAKTLFHDVAGWVMMPVALCFLGMELAWLDRLWIPNPGEGAATGSSASLPGWNKPGNLSGDALAIYPGSRPRI